MGANLEIKKQLVADLSKELKNAKSIIFVDYKGISVCEDTNLRRAFRNSNVTYKVFKNRLLTRALDEAGFTGYDPKMFEGTTAIAFSDDEINPSKIFCETSAKLKKLSVRFGIVNGSIMNKNQIEAISKIPAKPVLVSMLLGMLNAPVSSLARALAEIGKKKEA